jgi:adenylate cyclase
MKSKLPVIISFCVLLLAIFIKIMDLSAIRNAQLKVFDSFQLKHPREFIKQPVAIIDIDDASLEKLGQWPWPRNILAEIVNKLNQGGAAAIGFDIVFAEEDRTSPKNILPLWGQSVKLGHLISELPDHDEMLSKAIGGANVVTGFVLTGDKTDKMPKAKAGYSYTGVDPKPYLQNFVGGVSSIPILENASHGNGALNSTPDGDGILRRTPTVITANGQFYSSLAMETLRIAQGASSYIIKSTGASDEPDYGAQAVTSVKIGQFTIPTDSSGKLLVYYTGHRDERFFPAWKVLEPDFDAKQFEGYILLFGTSAAGLKDIRATPFSPTTAGIEVHAEAIEQILSGQFLYRPDTMLGAEITLMFVVGVILIIMMAYLPAILGALFTLAALCSAGWFSQYMFTSKHILIDPVTPGIAIILVFISESLMRYISAEREKKEVRNAFSHYMSPALVAQLAKDPKSLKLGGETKNLTMLFCDIRGFTTISEGLSAEELTSYINKFLTPMTNII